MASSNSLGIDREVHGKFQKLNGGSYGAYISMQLDPYRTKGYS
jgi:hypothetical protein